MPSRIFKNLFLNYKKIKKKEGVAERNACNIFHGQMSLNCLTHLLRFKHYKKSRNKQGIKCNIYKTVSMSFFLSLPMRLVSNFTFQGCGHDSLWTVLQNECDTSHFKNERRASPWRCRGVSERTLKDEVRTRSQEVGNLLQSAGLPVCISNSNMCSFKH